MSRFEGFERVQVTPFGNSGCLFARVQGVLLISRSHQIASTTSGTPVFSIKEGHIPKDRGFI